MVCFRPSQGLIPVWHFLGRRCSSNALMERGDVTESYTLYISACIWFLWLFLSVFNVLVKSCSFSFLNYFRDTRTVWVSGC